MPLGSSSSDSINGPGLPGIPGPPGPPGPGTTPYTVNPVPAVYYNNMPGAPITNTPNKFFDRTDNIVVPSPMTRTNPDNYFVLDIQITNWAGAGTIQLTDNLGDILAVIPNGQEFLSLEYRIPNNTELWISGVSSDALTSATLIYNGEGAPMSMTTGVPGGKAAIAYNVAAQGWTLWALDNTLGQQSWFGYSWTYQAIPIQVGYVPQSFIQDDISWVNAPPTGTGRQALFDGTNYYSIEFLAAFTLLEVL